MKPDGSRVGHHVVQNLEGKEQYLDPKPLSKLLKKGVLDRKGRAVRMSIQP